jgi:4-amino-4-deoxy-L-arabinose transferase-like glycosyltransferase
VLAALIVATGVMRLAFVFLYRFDSDEPQHLHVIWAWSHGLLQYRDVFDNHMPLFHWLCLPLYARVGDQPAAFWVMRLLMVPAFALELWLAFALGRELFGRRVGAWAAVMTAVFPLSLLGSVEFRPDSLWTALWLGTLWVLVRGGFTARRAAGAGLLLGLALCVSLKTTLFMLTLAFAGGILLASRWPVDGRRIRGWGLAAAALLVPVLLLPVPIGIFFVREGAWEAFWHGVVAHNLFGTRPWWRLAMFPLSLPALVWGAAQFARSAVPPGGRRAFLFLVVGVYGSALSTLWPLLSLEVYLPLYPVGLVFIAALLAGVEPAARRAAAGWRLLAPALTTGAAAVSLLLAQPWRNRAADQMALAGDVLRLTDPDDAVLDLKGELPFRRRALRQVMETVTRILMERGVIADTIAEQAVAARACVVTPLWRAFPARARAFIEAAYLDTGRLWVAGQWLPRTALADGSPTRFQIALPARYAVVDQRGPVAAELDGLPPAASRFLAAGDHTLRLVEPADGPVALVWAQAAERGFRVRPPQDVGVRDQSPDAALP